MFVWKMAGDVLRVKAKLSSFVQSYPCFGLCNNLEHESSAHLFIKCPFISAFWFSPV